MSSDAAHNKQWAAAKAREHATAVKKATRLAAKLKKIEDRAKREIAAAQEALNDAERDANRAFDRAVVAHKWPGCPRNQYSENPA